MRNMNERSDKSQLLQSSRDVLNQHCGSLSLLLPLDWRVDPDRAGVKHAIVLDVTTGAYYTYTQRMNTQTRPLRLWRNYIN